MLSIAFSVWCSFLFTKSGTLETFIRRSFRLTGVVIILDKLDRNTGGFREEKSV